jgi:hypothetical protein
MAHLARALDLGFRRVADFKVIGADLTVAAETVVVVMKPAGSLSR